MAVGKASQSDDTSTLRPAVPQGDRTPFGLFGLRERFDIDMDELARRYSMLRGRFHPDRLVRASAAERRVSESFLADLHEAHAVLADPVRRAGCLLALRGRDPFAESGGGPMPAGFLERQLELRERLEEIEDSNDAQAASGMARELDADIDAELGILKASLDGGSDDVDAAFDAARRLKYLVNCRELLGRLEKGG